MSTPCTSGETTWRAKSKYNVIYADPPWAYRDKRKRRKRICGGALHYYPTMSIKDIKNLPVAEIAADNCFLFLWATFPNMRYAFDTIDAWGFAYKTLGFSWIKTNKKNGNPFFGIGSYTRSNCEVCLLGTKGKPIVADRSVSSVVISPLEEHSKKPDEVRDRIVKLCGNAPRIELFARQKVNGWDALGYDIDGKDIRESIDEIRRMISI